MSDKCPECGGDWIGAGPISMTLVGFYSPTGHDHDDNCMKRKYWCGYGHTLVISLQRNCPSCDWVGRDECSCHPGKKVKSWPAWIEIP